MSQIVGTNECGLSNNSWCAYGFDVLDPTTNPDSESLT